jgi:glutamine synthetase
MATIPGLTAAGAVDHDEALMRRRVQELAEAGVRYVVASMVDSGSINRVKCFRLDDFARFARSGTGFSILWALVLSNDHFTTTDAIRGPVGDIRMLPDPTALVQLAATPEWAWAPMDLFDQEGAPLSICPRQFLKRMVAVAAARGLSLGMAYEFEWFMASLSEDGRVEPIHRGPGYSANAWTLVNGFMRDLMDAMQAQGVELSQLHPEYSDGQMEVSLGVADPVSAADWHVLFRHTARTVGAQHGYRSSFSPVTVPGLGNGCHLHFSLYDRSGENLFTGGDRVVDLTATGEAFLAGVLAELDALIALACPTVPSYERLQPQHWAGAYRCWGHENREAALRFIKGMAGGRRQTANMEFKAVDGAGHPYLLPGALIAAGLHGVEQDMRLPEPCWVDPATCSAEDLAACGISRLPASLGEAAERLAASQVLRDAMGPLLHDCMVAVRCAEAEADEGRPIDELVREQLWRF